MSQFRKKPDIQDMLSDRIRKKWMESGHVFQGILKGLLSEDSVPSFMCASTPTKPISPLPYIWKVTFCLPSLVPLLHLWFFVVVVLCFIFSEDVDECYKQDIVACLLLFAVLLQETGLSFKMSPGACHHLDHLASLIMSGISMWTFNEQSAAECSNVFSKFKTARVTGGQTAPFFLPRMLSGGLFCLATPSLSHLKTLK